MRDKASFKIALVQMVVEGGQKQRNLCHAEELVAEAAAHGAELALLPEALDLGWTHPSCQTLAGPIPDGETYQMVCDTARRHGIYICAGLVESAGGTVFNSAVIVDREGRLRLFHRKLNELTIAQGSYAQGDRLNVCQTEFGTLGLMICADAFAHDRVLSRALCYMGADVILSPCAWAVPADHNNQIEPYGKTWRAAYAPVAKEFSVWILGVSNVGWITAGPWAGRKCIGCSLVIGPGGKEITEGPYGVEAETILYVDVAPVKRPARGDGWLEYWRGKENL